ncbi:MAG: AMP-binding protein, partial [candidate division Zixibacteria bacterium]|nr:AMP-binding protein [candidate division Zixibacteria bacterium]
MLDYDILKSITIPQFLRQIAEAYGAKTAFYCFRNEKWETQTFAELKDSAEAVARGLLAEKLQKNCKIALLGENSPVWCQAYLGILTMGGSVVPLDPQLKSAELTNVLAHSGAEAILVSAKFADSILDLIRSGLEIKKVVVLDDDTPRSGTVGLTGLKERGKNWEDKLPAVSNLDLATIIYTSGTTGNSKGVMLTHKNILSDIWSIHQRVRLNPDDRFLSVMPLHHTFECTCGFLFPLSTGAGVIYSRSLKSKELVEDISSLKATLILAVPLLFEKMWLGLTKGISGKSRLARLYFKFGYGTARILPKLARYGWGRGYFSGLRAKAGLGSLRLIVCGGAATPPDLAKNFDCLGIKYLQGYGLTETSPVLTVNPENGYRYSSIGKPLRGVELKIGEPGPHGIGEILAKGDMVMSGYYRNPAETAKVLKDGWLHTGDAGWRDEQGYFYISGRIKNVIVTPNGKNIYPEEIETELVKSPFIAEALVLGKHTSGGEEVHAVIVPDYE